MSICINATGLSGPKYAGHRYRHSPQRCRGFVWQVILKERGEESAFSLKQYEPLVEPVSQAGNKKHTHLSVPVTKVDAQSAHSSNDRHQWLYCVTVDNWLELFVVFAGKPAFVNNPVSPHSKLSINCITPMQAAATAGAGFSNFKKLQRQRMRKHCILVLLWSQSLII